MTDRPPDQLCIIRLSAIGDCCHAIPVVRRLQESWPETRLTWIIGKTEHALVDGMQGVEFVILDKRSGLAGFADVRRRLAGRRFPILLDMHASMRSNFASLCVDANRRIGFDRARARDYQWLFTNEKIDPRPRQHVMDGLFQFIEHLGLERGELRWDIPLTEADRAFAADLVAPDRRTCIISPCSSPRLRNYRNWSVNNYVELVDWLAREYGAQVILTGGPTEQEREYGRLIEAGAARIPTNLVGRTTLKQLVALLERADLVVCPDSGPAHLATAVGTPVVGLYATSNRHRTGPYLSPHLVADRYPDAVAREFGKPVEALRWGQRVRDPEAMNLITTADVVAKVALAWGSTSRAATS